MRREFVYFSNLLIAFVASQRYNINDIIPFGGEILDLSIERGLDNETIHKIRDDLLLHKVLVFRNQSDLTVASQRNFSSLFGSLLIHGNLVPPFMR